MSDDADESIRERAESYLGRSLPRPNVQRLIEGRGVYTDDVKLPRMVHVAYLRSPYAHADIVRMDTSAAEQATGVVAVVDGEQIAEICRPWTGILSHLPGMKSVPQYPLAVGRARWQGEPVAAVVAESRALAEDALELIEIEFEELPALTDEAAALEPGAEPIHPELGDNLLWERLIDEGDVDKAFAEAAVVVEESYVFGRHTGVTMETRTIIADFDPSEEALTVHQSTQTPHQMQSHFSTHFGIDEHKVRVISGDVGGAFGMKAHVYGDEFAAAGLAILLRRPVKFTPDRLESFTGDLHARGYRAKARMALTAEGRITALELDGLTGAGPFSMFPRSSTIETNQIVNLSGGCYMIDNYRARGRIAFQNKAMISGYRAVGHPIATAVTEGLVELAAAELGMDPLELRRRNMAPDDSYPRASVNGMPFENLSHQAALARLEEMIGYAGLRQDQKAARADSLYRGIGFGALVEVSNPSPLFYGAGGAPISAQDGCTLRLTPDGAVVCSTGVTEQGQGAEAVVSQVAATAVGVTPDRVKVITGDTSVTPYGGGTWGSRGTGIAGEAVNRAGKALRHNILDLAGAMLQSPPASLDIRRNAVVDKSDGKERISLSELGRIAHYRQDTLPDGYQPELVATRHYVPKGFPFAFTNGIHAAHLEVDVDTGLVKILGYWVVEDCGTVINPLLVDEQIRGGVVQGLGGVLFEECIYNSEGQMLNGNLADYLVPMAAEMPDIQVAHVVSRTSETDLGAKGAGEAGTGGAPAAVMNAINDALRPLGARVNRMPFTPERILRALGKVAAGRDETT